MGNAEVNFLSCSANSARCCYGGTTVTCKALNYKGLPQLTVWRVEEKWVQVGHCTQKLYPCRNRAVMWCVTGLESRDSKNSLCAELAPLPPNPLQVLLATTAGLWTGTPPGQVFGLAVKDCNLLAQWQIWVPQLLGFFWGGSILYSQ